MNAYPDGRLTAEDAAAYVGLKVGTLANMRMTGAGPRYIKRGRIFYRLDDLNAWLDEGRVSSTTEAKAKARMRAASNAA